MQLQAPLAIIQNPKKQWKNEMFGNIMKACIIMHNLIMKNKQHYNFDLSYDPKSMHPLIWGISHREFV